MEERITELNQINTETKEGKMLFAALAKITTESQKDKTPDEVISQLNELQDKMSLPANDICYKTNEPCKHNCKGLCKESY